MSDIKQRGDSALKRIKSLGNAFVNHIPEELEYCSIDDWKTPNRTVREYLKVVYKNRKYDKYSHCISVSVKKSLSDLALCLICFSAEFYLDNVSQSKAKALIEEEQTGDYYFEAYSTNGEKITVKAGGATNKLFSKGPISKLIVTVEIPISALEDLPQERFNSASGYLRDIYYTYESFVKLGVEEWWPSLEDYDPGITPNEYVQYFTSERIVKRTWLEALYELYRMPNCAASCKQLGDRYGHSPSHYISFFSSAGQNIQKETGIGSPEDDKNAKCWPVLFQGKNSEAGYCYKMREPVVQAMNILMSKGVFLEKENNTMAQFDHNLILYGPPGTGKTYHSVIYAVAICEGRELDEVKKETYSEVLSRYRELKEDGRIAFTTFHQSYGYEEFIEGIKPKLNSDDDSLGYIIEDGVFKDFCKRARSVKVQSAGNLTIKAQPRIWGMLLGGTGMTDLKRRCFANNEIRLGFTEVNDDDVEADIIGDSEASWPAKHMVYDFISTVEIGDIVVIEKDNRSIDAIGVVSGDYQYDPADEKYPRSRAVKWLVKEIDQDMLQYLPNGRKQLSRYSLFAFDYIGMDAITQILNENTLSPVMEVDQETKPYVFVIDEINRGNISKIFGELITLIEDSKRAGASEAMEAILPYSGESFSVPNNVYILGTMNTADRSIALMDTALRRRFEFIEMMPNSEILESLGVGTIVVDGEELNVARMLDVINERIEYLFDREHTIGHAFFTKLSNDPSIDTLASIFEKNVIPLLQEYFYEDYEKIQLVLGENDNQKEDEFKFILDKKVELKQVFKGNPDIDLPSKGYSIQRSAFRKLQSYKQIGKDL